MTDGWPGNNKVMFQFHVWRISEYNNTNKTHVTLSSLKRTHLLRLRSYTCHRQLFKVKKSKFGAVCFLNHFFLMVIFLETPDSPSCSPRSTAFPFLRTGLAATDTEAAVGGEDTWPLSTLSFLSLESCSLVETPIEEAAQGLGVLQCVFIKMISLKILHL